ncbi:MAG: DUF4442 domain-containing protein [Chitinophagaceae bacterium]|nr:MAG: DUF4442 domain-containing protein [Chitinophagaceae bacterium]
MSPGTKEFITLAKHPLKFRLFLLAKLPSAFFAGLKVREMDAGKAVVSVPFKWFTKNPFRSTYFACLAMAAEMSTGALAMAMIYKRKPAVSMLVVGLKADYFKKATGRTWFTCEDGALFRDAIEQSAASGESVTVTARSTGRNTAGETIAIFELTWSFKVKTKMPDNI